MHGFLKTTPILVLISMVFHHHQTFGQAVGLLENGDDRAYRLELSCSNGMFTSLISAAERVVFVSPASSGCLLKVVESNKSLRLKGHVYAVKIEGGAPHNVARQLTWNFKMPTYGHTKGWPKGVTRQWAVGAKASSEYSPTGWSAMQATGPPNTFACGDIQTAFTTQPSRTTERHWIDLRYPKKMRAIGARLFITNAPGAVAEVQGKTGSGWFTLWRGKDPTGSCPAVLAIAFNEEIDTDTIRIVLDLSRQTSWFELDAVELIGRPL